MCDFRKDDTLYKNGVRDIVLFQIIETQAIYNHYDNFFGILFIIPCMMFLCEVSLESGHSKLSETVL